MLLFSILLLVVSLWMRLKLSESPVFKAMKEADRLQRNKVRLQECHPVFRAKVQQVIDRLERSLAAK